jgi:hypothetical protein
LVGGLDDFPRFGPGNVSPTESLFQLRQLFEAPGHRHQRAGLAILEAQSFSRVVHGRGEAVLQVEAAVFYFLEIKTKDRLYAAMHARERNEASIDLTRRQAWFHFEPVFNLLLNNNL